jgi:hypothetical protein
METCLVGDDHVQGLRIEVGNLLKKDRVDILVDRRSEQQFGPMGSIHLQCFVQIALLVARGSGGMDSHSPPGLDSANHRQQSIAVFVENPNAHPWVRIGSHHFTQALGQLRFELVGLGRIFFGVAFARHL